ncbi:MAG: hypothetical protein AAES65_07810 [Candidatus Thiodiazotropha sp. (ex. Lucinoma kazani)]
MLTELLLPFLIPLDRNKFITRGLIKEDTNTKSIEKTLEEIIKDRRDKLAFLPAYGDMYAAAADFSKTLFPETG